MGHLVLCHYDGYAIDYRSEEEITKACKVCDDSDIILASWDDKDDENNENMYNALLTYFLSSEINSPESFERILKIYGATKRGYSNTIEILIANITYDNEVNKEVINTLYNKGQISKDIRDGLLKEIKLSLARQIKYIKKYDYNQIDFKKFKQSQRSRRRISE